jgi:hypothetical protein
VVARVTSEVQREAVGAEKAFQVSDLNASVADLAKAGGLSAWKITYDTKREADFARPGALGGVSAWKITYDTKREADFGVPRDVLRGTEPE